MQADILDTLQAWAVSALIYPGLLFGIALSLVGEWALHVIRPSLAPRIYRSQARAYHLAQPFYNFLKLAGRREEGAS